MPCRDLAVVRHGATQFKPASDLLRMVTFHAAARRKIRWTSEHQVKALIVSQHSRFAKIPLLDFVTRLKPVPLSRLSRQQHALFLGFNRHEPRARQSPRSNHSHRADPAAEVECRPRSRTPTCAIPCRQHVVRRETVAVLELKKAKVAADGVERLARPDR